MSLAPWAWAVFALLLIALIVALVMAAVMWRKARRAKPPALALPLEVAQLQPPMFAAAMAALYPNDADCRYDKPCVLVCGPAGAGKSELLRGAGMQAVEALPGKDSGWWRSSEGVAFELPGAAWEAQADSWTDFLRLLERHRGRRALDALVWLIPLVALENGNADGERMYRKFVDLQDRLGLRLPVYVVIGGCDQVDGFGAWAARLPDSARAQALGWSNPNSLGTLWRRDDGEQGVARLCNRLRRLVSALSARRDLGDDAAGIFLMPDRIGAALSRLPPALQEAMRQNAVMTPFDLRGFYLSGRTRQKQDHIRSAQAGADPFEPAPAPPAAPVPVFCRELFAQRIFGEFGLARLVQRRLDAERRSHLMVLSGACLLAMVWLVCLVPAYYATRDQLESIRRPLLGVRSALQAARSQAPGAAARIDERSTIELLTEMDNVPDWHTATVALPLSWQPCCGGLRYEVNRALSLYYEEVLFKNIDNALVARSASLTPPDVTAAGTSGELAADPGRMPQFTALRTFVDATLEYEYQHAKFIEVTSVHHGSWKDTAALLHYLFGIKLGAASPDTLLRFDALLQKSSYHPSGRGADTDELRFQAHLKRLHRDFLGHLFSDNRLRELQRQLVDGIQALDTDQAEQQVQLASLQRDIGELRTLLTRTDAAWMADGRLVSSEAYQQLEGKIGKSSMLGEKLAGELHAEASRQQTRFRAQVETDSSGAFPVLAYSDGKHLLVNPDLANLEQALAQLLQHRFAKGGAGGAAAIPEAQLPLVWNMDQLNGARDVLAELQAYEVAELAKAPVPYQATLRKLARLQAAALIEHELAAAAVPAQCETRWRCANFDDARQVMGPLLASLRKLEITSSAQRWQRLMDGQAMALLRELNQLADNGSLYLPDAHAVAGWDGARGGASLAYGVRAAGELQDYLDGQLLLVSELAQASHGPRAWLAQSGALAPREAQPWLADWSRVDAELARHAAKTPTGSLRRLEQWLNDDVAGLDSANCAQRLSRLAPAQPDLFQRRMVKVAALYRPHCFMLEAGVSRSSYALIAAHFNRHLHNRFPFSAARDAAPADPEQVQRLLQLLDANLGTLRATLGRQKDLQSAAALAFIERLAAAQPLLSAVLTEDPAGGPAALDLWPQFRINRAREKGAEQIIEWTLHAGGTLPPAAAGASAGVSWRAGEPISMVLRWAKNSVQGPGTDPARPEMRISDGAARWQYDDPWALLHLLADHAAPLSDLAERDARAPVVLRFVVPTRDAAGAPAGDTVAYARLAVSVHGKPERLAAPAFPTNAAPSLAVAGTKVARNRDENGESQ